MAEEEQEEVPPVWMRYQPRYGLLKKTLSSTNSDSNSSNKHSNSSNSNADSKSDSYTEATASAVANNAMIKQSSLQGFSCYSAELSTNGVSREDSTIVPVVHNSVAIVGSTSTNRSNRSAAAKAKRKFAEFSEEVTVSDPQNVILFSQEIEEMLHNNGSVIAVGGYKRSKKRRYRSGNMTEAAELLDMFNIK